MNYKLKSFKKSISVTKIANIHYFEFTNEYHTFKDRHPFRELIYVDSGSINVNSENYCGSVDSNFLIIHKDNEEHSLTCSSESAPNVIIIGFECHAEELDDFSKRPFELSAECRKLLTEVIREGRSVFLPPYDVPNITDMKKRKDYLFGADQMIKLKLETFFIELIRCKDISHDQSKTVVLNDKSEEIYNYIKTNFRQKINLDELCFLYGTNKTSLCFNFKLAYGETVISLINKLKIKEAKKLMREGKLNLSQISLEVGFSSLHYFSRMFKLYEGVSPSEYIKTIKLKLGV